MERSLVWSALAIGLACWLAALALTRTKRFAFAGTTAAVPPAFLWLAAGLPLLLFILTMPSHGRLFAPGHDLGNGFLFGSVGALLSGVLLIQNMLANAAERGHLRTAAVTACPFGMAVSCAAISLLIPHDTLYVALLGSAIGWLATSAVLLLGLMHGKRSGDSLRPEPVTMLAGACFAALLCATVVLGDFHGEVTFAKTSTSLSWGVLALASAASVPLFLLLSAAAGLLLNPETDRRTRGNPNAATANVSARAQFGRAAIVIVGVAAFGRMLSNRVIDSTPESPAAPGRFTHLINGVLGPSNLFHVLSIGLLVGLLVWWISVTVQNREHAVDAAASSPAWQNGALAILVVLAGTMAAYQMLAGFGVGLMLLGVMPAVGLALITASEPAGGTVEAETLFLHTESAIRVVQLASMGGVLALFRLYTTVNDGLFPHSPYTDQYAVFGFVAGAALPLFLAEYLIHAKSINFERPSVDAFTILGRLLVSGALLLALPSIMLVLWGQKCIMAFLVAMAITSGGLGSTSAAADLAGVIRKLFPAIYSVGLSLALCEWCHYIVDMEDWTRIQKERVIVQIVGAAIVLVFGMDYGPKIAGWAKKDRRPDSNPNTAGKGAAR